MSAAPPCPTCQNVPATAAVDVDDIARVLWIHDTPATHGITTRHRRLALAIFAHLHTGDAP